jgi:hypothetical protein
MSDIDPFKASNVFPHYPPRKAISVTPSDTVDLPFVTTDVYIGGTGSLKVIFADDADATPVTLTAMPIGWYRMQVRRIMVVAAPATLIVAMRG